MRKGGTMTHHSDKFGGYFGIPRDTFVYLRASNRAVFFRFLSFLAIWGVFV